MITGIIFGLTYGFIHVIKDHLRSDLHQKCRTHCDRGELKNYRQVFFYVLTAEFGCVLGATFVEYTFGKLLSIPGAPWEFYNLMVRCVGLPFAFITGLFLMSLGTIYQKRKRSIFI